MTICSRCTASIRSPARSGRPRRRAARASWRRRTASLTSRMPPWGLPARFAEFRDGQFTIWSHTQGVFPLRLDLAKSLQVDPAAICCIFAEGAGCYGRNGHDDVALDAALLARAVPGRPVRVQWMRDDEFGWEPYGPAMVMKANGAVAEGRILDWQYELW